MGRCWRAERAASTWHAARFRPLGAVQKGLFLISCIQFNTAMPKPYWFWRAGGLDGVHVGPRLKQHTQWSHLSRWTARGAQHAPVAWPLFTFGRPLAARCWASTYVLPLPVPHRPPVKGPACHEVVLCPGEPSWGSARSSREAPIHFQPYYTGRFRVLSTCKCWAEGCCCKRWRVRPSWYAGNAQHAVMLLPDPRHVVRGCLSFSSPTSK